MTWDLVVLAVRVNTAMFAAVVPDSVMLRSTKVWPATIKVYGARSSRGPAARLKDPGVGDCRRTGSSGEVGSGVRSEWRIGVAVASGARADPEAWPGGYRRR